MKKEGIALQRRTVSVIINCGIAVVVLVALYLKMKDEGANAVFRSSDVYLLAGALLAFVFLRILRSKGKR